MEKGSNQNFLLNDEPITLEILAQMVAKGFEVVPPDEIAIP